MTSNIALFGSVDGKLVPYSSACITWGYQRDLPGALFVYTDIVADVEEYTLHRYGWLFPPRPISVGEVYVLNGREEEAEEYLQAVMKALVVLARYSGPYSISKRWAAYQ